MPNVHVLNVNTNTPREAQKRGYDEDVQVALGGSRPSTSPYVVTVKLVHDWQPVEREIEPGVKMALLEPTYEPGSTAVIEIAVRRRDGGNVSTREIRRLPLKTVVDAALVAVSVPVAERTEGDWLKRVRRASVPKKGPQHGHSYKFYKQLAAAHRRYASEGKRPAVEIAREMGVPANRVHQWILRARRMRLLEPSPQAKNAKGAKP